MAGALLGVPGPALAPSSVKAALPGNYITDFNFLNQYLPDTYEKRIRKIRKQNNLFFYQNGRS